MRKLMAVVAVAAGLMLGSVANAAQIDVFLTQTNATDWDVTVNNNSAENLGGVQFLVAGFTAIAPNLLNPNIDNTGLTALIPDPLAIGMDFAIFANAAGGLSIADAGAVGALLGVLSGPGPVSYLPLDDPDYGAESSALSAAGNPLTLSITVNPIVVPEPTSMVLLGLGLAALGFVRRSA